MDSIRVLDREGLLRSVKEVHSDNSPKNWLIVSHKDGEGEEVALSSEGEGGISEFIDNLEEDKVQYGLLRTNHKIDLSSVVRFVAINVIPGSIGLAESARYGRAQSLMVDLLGQTHVTIEVGSKQDLSEDLIISKISAAAGTNKNFYDADANGSSNSLKNYRYTPLLSPRSAKASSPSSGSNSFVPDEPHKSPEVSAEQELIDSIASIKEGSDQINWIVYSYRDNDAKKPLYLVASGNSGLDGMKQTFSDDTISYGFIRLDTVVDGRKYPKLVFVRWIGHSVSAVNKAKACVQAVSVARLLGDTHLEISASDKLEVDEATVLKRLVA